MDFFEELVTIFVTAAATMVVLMILIFVGTVSMNASFTLGWIALFAGLIAAVIVVWKCPVPMEELASDPDR